MSDKTTRDLLDARFDQLVSLVNKLTDNQAATDARVERLERVLEERLYDTRPIWEAVRTQLQEIGERVGKLESAMPEIETRIAELLTHITEMRVENGNAFRGVDRKIGVLGKTLIDMTADIRELQDKV